MTARPLLAGLLFAAAGLLVGCVSHPPPSGANLDNAVQREVDAAARARDADDQQNRQNNTVLDPQAQQPTQAPYAPELPARDNPLGPGPQTPGQGPSNAPDQ